MLAKKEQVLTSEGIKIALFIDHLYYLNSNNMAVIICMS